MAENMQDDYDIGTSDYWNNTPDAGDDFSSADYWNSPSAAKEEAGDFISGVKSGYENLKAAGHGASALLGGAFGNEEWQASALEDYQAATARAGEHQGRVTHIEQIKGFGDLLDFAQFHMGSGMVSTLPTLIGGGVGSIAAKKALTGYIEGKVADEIKKGVAEDVALKTVGASIAKKGAAAGGFAAADTQLSGLTFGNIYEETGEIERGKSLISGTGQAALEIIPGMAVLRKMGLGKVAQEGIQEAADGILKATGKIAGQEALTEGGQNIIETATLKWVDENRDLLGEEGYLGVLNAMAAGAAGGAGMGAGSHLIGRGPLRGVKLTPEQKEQNRKKLQAIQLERANAKAQAAADATGGDSLTRSIAEQQSHIETDGEVIGTGRTLPGDLNEYPAGEITETFEPLVGDDGVTQLKPGEQPIMPQRNAGQGIDGLIATANKLGFEEEAVRLTTAKDLYKRAATVSKDGDNVLAGRLADKANAIRNDILKQPVIEQEFANQYPVEYTFIVEGVEGGELATTDNQNFTMPDADIEGESLRVPTNRLEDRRGTNRLEDSGTIYAGQDPVVPGAPGGDYQGVGDNIINRTAGNQPLLGRRNLPSEIVDDVRFDARRGNVSRQQSQPITSEELEQPGLEQEAMGAKPQPVMTPEQPVMTPATAEEIAQDAKDEAKIKRQERGKEQARKTKIVNSDKDSIAEAVAKLGGLNEDSQIKATGDNKANRNVPFAGHVFNHKTGVGFDEMAMLLHEQGYIPAAEMGNLGGEPYLTEALQKEFGGMGKVFAPGSKAESAAMEQQEQDAREQESFAEEAALEKIKLEREAVELELKQLESLYPEAAITAAPSKMEIEVDEYYQGLESTRPEQLPGQGAVAQAGQEAQGDYQAAGVEHTQDQAAEGLTLATETDGIKAKKPTAKEAKATDDKAQIDRERDFFGLEQQNNQSKSEGNQGGLDLAPKTSPTLREKLAKAAEEKAKKGTPLSEIIVVHEDGKKESADKALANSIKRLDALYALKACINGG